MCEYCERDDLIDWDEDEVETCIDEDNEVSHDCDCSYHRLTRNFTDHYRECADCADRVGFIE